MRVGPKTIDKFSEFIMFFLERVVTLRKNKNNKNVTPCIYNLFSYFYKTAFLKHGRWLVESSKQPVFL